MANEKRLIDAKQLKTDMYLLATLGNNENIFIDVIIDEIDNADDVDAVEVVHGRWNKHDRSGLSIKGFMACSACNVMIPTADDNRYCLHRLNYCPNCGAKMDGDGNG